MAYQEEKIELSEELGRLNLNTHRLNNLIRRYARKCKGKVPYCKDCRSIMLDCMLYKYSTNEQGQFGIAISLLEKGKRLFKVIGN